MSTSSPGSGWEGDTEQPFDERKPLLGKTTDGQITYTDSTVSVQADYPVKSSNLPNTPDLKVYKARWWIVFIFFIFGATQGAIWNTWGPISDSCKVAFGWTDGTIALLNNWAPIAYVTTMPFFSYMMSVKGLRWSMLLATFMIALGTGLRCITSVPTPATVLINIGQLLNGAASIAALAAPPIISATWFPPNQRTTATAICAISAYVGASTSYLVSPALVSQPADMGNSTANHSSFYNGTNHTEVVAEQRREIMRMMYIECGWCVAVFLAILLYFPDKPPSPPSRSASTGRLNVKSGLKDLFHNRNFLLVWMAYGVSTGVMGGWIGVLDIVLSTHGISQVEAGMIGFYGNIAGCVSALAFGIFADVFSGHMKLLILVLVSIASGTFTWFTLMLWHHVIPLTKAEIYVSFIASFLTLNACIPMFYELVMETTYPVAEAISAGVMTWMNNFFALIFLLIPLIPHIGVGWMNWAALGGFVFTIPLMVFFKEKYRRLQVDTGQATS